MKLPLAIALVAACVDSGSSPQGKKIEPSYVRAHLVKEVPADVRRLDVALGDAVVYVGNRVDVAQVAPGGTLHVTHYWRVVHPPGAQWRVVTFARGAPNSADFMNLPATDMELGHPPSSWAAGELVEDVQEIVVRPDWRSQTLTLYAALVAQNGHDVGDRMPAAGSNVVDRAVVAANVRIDLAHAPAPPGTVYVPRAAGPIAIDGIANDVGWGNAVMSPEFLPAEGGGEPIGRATAKLSWDETYLYVFVTIADTDVVSPYKQHDESMWKADVVEIFIDADMNRRGYVELQVNPNGATFDTWWANTRAGAPPEGDKAWESGMIAAVKVRGTPEPNDTDQGWDAEIAIPWAAVKGRDDAMKVRLPPNVGDRMAINVVRVDGRSGSKDVNASSWNRITTADFHALDRMLTIVFADQNGSIVPSAAAGSGAGLGSGAGVGSGTGSGTGTGTGSGTGTGTGTGSGTGTGTGSAATRMTPQPSVILRAQSAGSNR
jgi:hypothetical protein